MQMPAEEREELKNQTKAVANAIYDEIKKRLEDNNLNELKNLPFKVLLDQFSEYMKLLKVQDPKINLSIPISFDPDKASEARKLSGPRKVNARLT